jgi:carboxymethylenebutenolidase
MCDQEHFEKDRLEYERLGWVTRKQFGAVLGAMMLPKVADAAAVTESDVTVKTPDGAADCYFVHRPAALRLPSSCGRTSSDCVRPCDKWGNGLQNPVIRCSW